ncbi:MAG: alpha/beta hydrolase [Actinomycetales bacterium]
MSGTSQAPQVPSHSRRGHWGRRMSALVATVTMLASPALLAPASGAAATPPSTRSATGIDAARQHAVPESRTSAREARRVDRVPTPELAWLPCQGAEYAGFLCTTVTLPLDYDAPRAGSVSVALLKVPAGRPDQRIGSLFLNPGGPGGSGKGIAVRASQFVSPDVRARFDLIGMDPRGTNDSQRVQCYPSAQAQARDLAGLAMVFPVGADQESTYATATTSMARACSRQGRPLSASMSTAQVARDLDVLRRAVGDARLSYLGWSYGTYLGQVYAALFPDRVRAMVIDGVVDPIAWQGTHDSRSVPMTMRMDNASGSWRAMSTLLDRCQQVGPAECPLGADPWAAFDSTMAELRDNPIVIDMGDGTSFTVTYATFVHDLLLMLYVPETAAAVPAVVQLLRSMQAPPASGQTRAQLARGYRSTVAPAHVANGRRAGADPANDDLANDYELNAAVACSDSQNPRQFRRWADLADEADRRSPYFGRFWLWQSATCASWTARDEDGYRGDFASWTAGPVLVVGNVYDPATTYESAVRVAQRLPNARLLSSDAWGHTAYAVSACATRAMDVYLLDLTLPAEGTFCRDGFQPFGSE